MLDVLFPEKPKSDDEYADSNDVAIYDDFFLPDYQLKNSISINPTTFFLVVNRTEVLIDWI